MNIPSYSNQDNNSDNMNKKKVKTALRALGATGTNPIA